MSKWTLNNQEQLVEGIIDTEVFIDAVRTSACKGLAFPGMIDKQTLMNYIEIGTRAGIAFGQKGGKDGTNKGTEAGSNSESSS